MNQDTVFSVIFGGKIRWFWGDTGRLSYPLGNFETTGAVSCSPFHSSTSQADPCLPVEEGINLQYYTLPLDPKHPDAPTFVKPMATLPPMPYPTWIGSLSVVSAADAPPEDNATAMLAYFMKAGPDMNTLRHGVLRWNSANENFTEVVNWSMTAAMSESVGGAHAVTASTGATLTTVTMSGTDWVVFSGRPWPQVRVKATVEDFSNLASYQGWTLLSTGSIMEDPKVARTSSSFFSLFLMSISH